MTRLLRNLSGKEIVRALERLGFVQVRQKGSLFNAQKPVPLGVRNITGNILHAAVFGALSEAVPLQVQAD
jgi:hypothetical protein